MFEIGDEGTPIDPRIFARIKKKIPFTSNIKTFNTEYPILGRHPLIRDDSSLSDAPLAEELGYTVADILIRQ